MMNKLRKGLVIVAMAGLVFTTNAPATQVSAATKSCTTSTTCKTGSTFNCGNLKYKVLGWRVDDVAGPEDYVGGYVPDSDEIWDLPSINYAVYSRTVTISYNSNGGSGSMSDSTGTAFYSSSGNKEPASISLKNCTFTPPTGK